VHASAILDIPEVRERVQRWSVEEYERFVEDGVFQKNSELLRGFVIEKMAKSPLHFSLSLGIYERLKPLLPNGYTARHEGPLRLADSVPEPDVAIVRGEPGEFFEKHPTTAALVIEIAISSAALDRENASLYAEAGVEEYWIVLPRQQQVEAYRRPTGSSYAERTVYTTEAVLECQSIAGLKIAAARLLG